MNVKEEYGKWFMDVAKYVLTAMLLTTMIEGMSQTWITVTTAVIVLLSLTFGTILMRKGKEEEDRKERNREKNRNKKR
jgi:Sec-independent protein secretion pathway component TatC